MTLDVHAFPCRTDNYGYLVRDRDSGRTAAVDAPDAGRVLEELAALGWGGLDLLLITHWHPDHTEGAARLKAETGCEVVGPEEAARVTTLDRIVRDGDVVDLGQTRFEATEAPGHTLGHLVYLAAEAGEAFTGDVLFALGCGRLFEGTPEQMWASLQALAAWPEETRVWFGHEYTASNARFAMTQDARPEMQVHAQDIFARRERGEATTPTTIGVETRFNPFLTAADAAEFAARRAAKDAA